MVSTHHVHRSTTYLKYSVRRFESSMAAPPTRNKQLGMSMERLLPKYLQRHRVWVFRLQLGMGTERFMLKHLQRHRVWVFRFKLGMSMERFMPKYLQRHRVEVCHL